MQPTCVMIAAMKRRVVIGLTVLCGLVSACGDGSSEPTTESTLRVRVEYPAAYGERAARGAEVTVELPGGARTATVGSDGEARFEGVPRGAWGLRARRSLTVEETRALTGHARAVELTAESSTSASDAGVLTVTLAGPRLGGLVIRELYYSGSPGVGGNHYFSDQFVEVYNNSTETIFVDGLCVADLHGPAGEINPGTAPTPYSRDAENVYAESVWQVPGTGREHPLAPGESLVIAHDGTNHQPFSVLDLSDADWETYNERTDNRDTDSPTVPNLRRVVFNGGFDWLVPVFGASVVIFRVDDLDALERVAVSGLSGRRVKVPTSAVLDAVDALMDADSARYKRVPMTLDQSFTHVSGTYTGESVRRRVVARVAGRSVVQDTDDSASDFETAQPPTPRGAQ